MVKVINKTDVICSILFFVFLTLIIVLFKYNMMPICNDKLSNNDINCLMEEFAVDNYRNNLHILRTYKTQDTFCIKTICIDGIDQIVDDLTGNKFDPYALNDVYTKNDGTVQGTRFICVDGTQMIAYKISGNFYIEFSKSILKNYENIEIFNKGKREKYKE